VTSPLLANIYLHYVLDKWFVDEVKPRLKGKAFLIRYVDDAVICFQKEEDARKVLEVLGKRFSKHGLTLHPDKTRLVEFGRAALEKAERMGKAPETFDFLGFTHLPERSRRGSYRPGVRTMKKRMKRALKSIEEWCKTHRHDPVEEQQETLNAKLRGHYQYYGRSSNYRGIRRFYSIVKRVWRRWLSRRKRGNPMTWKKFQGLLNRHPLLEPEITHTWASALSPE
jgi:RNA-directed DNA polymerase